MINVAQQPSVISTSSFLKFHVLSHVFTAGEELAGIAAFDCPITEDRIRCLLVGENFGGIIYNIDAALLSVYVETGFNIVNVTGAGVTAGNTVYITVIYE